MPSSLIKLLVVTPCSLSVTRTREMCVACGRRYVWRRTRMRGCGGWVSAAGVGSVSGTVGPSPMPPPDMRRATLLYSVSFHGEPPSYSSTTAISRRRAPVFVYEYWARKRYGKRVKADTVPHVKLTWCISTYMMKGWNNLVPQQNAQRAPGESGRSLANAASDIPFDPLPCQGGAPI